MHLSYEYFLIKSEEAEDIESLNQLFLSILEPRGFDRMGLSLRTDFPEYGVKAQIAAAHNMPEPMIEAYHKNHLIDVDPVMKLATQISDMFKWSDVETMRPLNNKEERFMGMLKKSGLHHGYYIPLWGCNTLAGVGIASSQYHEGHEIHSDFVSVVTRQYYNSYLRLRKKEALKNNIPAEPRPVVWTNLKPREDEILHMIARGYKDPEIAKLLGVSPHTIDGHVRNIYKKLGAKTRTEAVAIALSHHMMWV